MTNAETKLDFINALESRDEYFRKVNETEYRIRCPYCGDSINNYNTGHMYINIDTESNSPIKYICFRCNESGVLTEELLGLLGITDINLKSGIHTLNRTCDKEDRKGIVDSEANIYFDYKIPKVDKNSPKVKYIERRLGVELSEEQLQDIKMITSIRNFLRINGITTVSMDQYMLRLIERDYVGFLSSGNSHILLRDTSLVWRDIRDKTYYKRKDDGLYTHYYENDVICERNVPVNVIKQLLSQGFLKEDTAHQKRWLKYPITKESQKNRIFYSMKSELDVLSTEPITINIAEGILDTLSAAYNLGYDKPNTLNMTVAGKYYERIILYITSLGLVGSNITVNIFADNDAVFNNKANNTDTSIGYYRKLLDKYKYLFKEINIFYNIIDKDIGVPKEKIKLKKYKL